ncbi:aldo/keto reductase [Beijerinckia sp. L45]|uniref:aldo/keto reductase n=1 Tax=Beijerinckia sp. L45 TaxID=1641855 RepID=UPI00131C156A|nr:aldo/keto reductase [Beijerinckia sp. L45]
MRQITMPDGTTVPTLGQGTWRMGEDSARRAEEEAALLTGIDLGMTLIDTAEMYGEGRTERFLGAALVGRRDDVYLVSKAYPQNASRKKLPVACEASLQRLKTDHLDLYLLHWPGQVPLDETVEAMSALQKAGKIKAWGVSNFDTDDMEELLAAGGTACATNQVLYNVTRRGPDYDLLPWMKDKGIPLMAYSPVEQGRLPGGSALDTVADAHGATPMQVALAWAMRDGAIVIPKAASVAHVRENRKAADLVLTPADIATLDASFPLPKRKQALAML